MSVLHLGQIRSRITSLFSEAIDLSDVKAQGHDRDSIFLTRATAAYALSFIASTPPDTAAAAVVDGGDDNGIDALLIDDDEKRLYVVQSKWMHDGKGEPSNADVKKFVAGIRDLFNGQYDRFNSKIQSLGPRVQQALSSSGWQYVAVLVYSGANHLADPSRRDLQDLLDEMNDVSPLLEVHVLPQDKLHASLTSSLVGNPISFDITLYGWGKIDAPFRGYYGQVNGTEVHHWWSENGSRLFARNLRSLLGDTDVNQEMQHTLSLEPEHFWYFNNGITIVAAKVEKTMAGGGDRDFGTFACTDLSIVNGAQTVSTIGKAASWAAGGLDKVRVPLRIISLNAAPADFGDRVTRNNNRQNRIESRDFASLDEDQKRLKHDLAIDSIDYHIVRSGSFAPSTQSFDLTESTTALACASGKPGIVVQLKREISKLWDDLTKAPYKELFNPRVSATYVWRCVQVQRVIDQRLSEIAKQHVGRDQGIAVHGNRMIALFVFSHFRRSVLDDPAVPFDISAHRSHIEKLVDSAYQALRAETEALFQNAILPTLFKNASKCTTLFVMARQKAGVPG